MTEWLNVPVSKTVYSKDVAEKLNKYYREKYTDPDGIVAERYFLKIFMNTRLPSSAGPDVHQMDVEGALYTSYQPTDFSGPFYDVPPSCYIS